MSNQIKSSGSIRWLWIAAVIILLDQLTKLWAIHNLHYALPKAIFPGFNLTLLYNYGAAFSFLDNSSKTWQLFLLSGIAIVVVVALLVWLTRIPRVQKMLPIGLCLIMGGAIGNLYDRIAYGYVIDFLDFYIKAYHWPAFNIADSAICIGAFLVIWSSFKAKEK